MTLPRALQLTAALVVATSLNCTAKPALPLRETLEHALALPPGATAIELRMHGTWYAVEQAADPADSFRRIDVDQSVLVTDDGRYRVHVHSKAVGVPQLRFLTIGSPSGSATIELTGRRGTEISRAPAERARQEYGEYLLLAPALFVRETLTRSAPWWVDGGEVAAVRVGNAAGDIVTLTLDPRTSRICASRAANGQFVYEEYQVMEGVIQPTRVVQYAGERRLADWRVDEVTALADLATEAFRLPPGHVEKADRGPLRATSLGHGAYRVDGAPSDYHTGFVVGERSVAVFDAPIGRSDAELVKALIQRTAAGRRIAYVIVSHPHADHVAGLPVYLDDGARVVAGANAGVALRRQLGGQMEMDLTEATQRHTLDLGGRTIEIYPLASAHSSAMLVGYTPESGTIFQGDLHFLPEVGTGEPAPEGPGSAELASFIAEHDLEVTQIVGVHGRTAGPEDIAALLRRRPTVPTPE